MGGGFHHLCPTAAFSQHGSSATWAHQRTEWDWFVLHPTSSSQQGSTLRALLLQNTSLAPGRGRGLQNSEELQAGVCFLERNLQSAIASCMHPSARCVCHPPQPRAACASLCCCTRLCRGCTCHIFKLLLPAWAWIWSPARQGKQGMSNCCFFSTASDKEFHPCRLSGMPGQAGETMYLCAWDSSCGQRLGVWSGGLF